MNLRLLRLPVGDWRFAIGYCFNHFAFLLALAFLLSGLPLPAQDTNGAPPFNDTFEDAVGLPQTNDVFEPDSAGQAEGLSSTNSEMQSNRNDQAGSRDGRYRRSRRQRQNSNGGSSSGIFAGSGSSATSTNGTNPLDYAAFRVVADRNIFNPNRQGYRSGGSRPRPKSVETFSLVGTMSYEKGTFAFFDGSGSEYRKALKTNDTIAGYQLTAIEPNAVKLAIQTNELVLRVGMQMRREEDGPWLKPSQPDTASASLSSVTSSSTNSAPDAPSSGADNDILKKLMQRREQE
jgi:hypothetical protein